MSESSVQYYLDPADGVTLDLNAQVPPFGATVNGALDLLPDATLLGQQPAPGGANRGLSRLQAFRWVQELSGQVALRVDGWTTLSTDPGTGFVSDRDNLTTSARNLVHNGVASYINAARFSGDDPSGYAATLWERYTMGLDALAAWMQKRLEGLDPADMATSVGGIVGSFPAPFYCDQWRF